MNPISVLHIPHSSDFIPAEERGNILLSDKRLSAELLKMTDWHTGELFTPEPEDSEIVLFPVSRLVLDPERFEHDAREVMAVRGMGVIYTKTSDGLTLRRSLKPDERRRMLDRYYAPHHARLSRIVTSILSRNGKALVIDCHSFPSAPLPYEDDQSPNRPDVCIGTDSFHTPARLTAAAKKAFVKRGFAVDIDRPFEGTLIPSDHFQKTRAVSGIMIELNRKLYMDENTTRRLPGFENVKRAVGDVVAEINRHFRGD